MGHYLSLYESGDSNTLVLSEGSYRLHRYGLRSGAADDETVTESLEIQVCNDAEITSSGTEILEMVANIGYIKSMFRKAREYQETETGVRVYVGLRMDGFEDIYRSEVIDGRVVEPETIFSADWANTQTTVQVTWTRRNYWEGPERLISLTGNTVGESAFVYQVNDHYVISGSNQRQNNALAPAAQVGGELPTPMKMTFANQAGPALTGLIIAQNVKTIPDSYSPTIEDIPGGTHIPASANYALYSGGFAMQYTMATTITPLGDYALMPGAEGTLAGRWFAVAAAMPAGANTDLELQVVLMVNGSAVYFGPMVRCTADKMQIIDTIQAPGAEAFLTGDVTLRLQGRRTSTATALVVDCLYLLPVDGLRVLRFLPGQGINPGESIVDDPIEGQLYELDSSFNSYFTLSGRGEIFLRPGQDQQLIFLPIPETYTPSQRNLVTLSYRPRRSTL
jgi:hypothetical protein